MGKRRRRNNSPALKTKVALSMVKSDTTLDELSKRFDVHPNQIAIWKKQLVPSAANAFGGEARPEPAVNPKTRNAKNCEQILNNECLEGELIVTAC